VAICAIVQWLRILTKPRTAGSSISNCQEPPEYSLDADSLFVAFFEVGAAVRDAVPRVVGPAPQIVAPLLSNEFGMGYRTDQQIRFAAIVERASVLNVAYALDGHSAFAVHLQPGGANDSVALACEPVVVLSSTRITRNKGFGLHLVLNVAEDGFYIVFGIAEHRGHGQSKFLGDILTARDAGGLCVRETPQSVATQCGRPASSGRSKRVSRPRDAASPIECSPSRIREILSLSGLHLMTRKFDKEENPDS